MRLIYNITMIALTTLTVAACAGKKESAATGTTREELTAEAVAVRGADERLLVGVGLQLNVGTVTPAEQTICCFGILCLCHV